MKEEIKPMKMSKSGKENNTSRMKNSQKKKIKVEDPIRKELLRVYDL